MRVTTDIWVHVFLRRETARGAFTTVINKGATEAGTIFIVEDPLTSNFNLYGPAPQSLLSQGDDDRKFEPVLDNVSEKEVDDYLARQKNFDPDIWVIETQCRQGPPSIDLAVEEKSEIF